MKRLKSMQSFCRRGSMSKIILTTFLIAGYFDFAASKSQTDYCLDDSIAYTYTPVIDTQLKWSKASKRCLTWFHGCLARPKNITQLKLIQKSIPKHAVHGPVIYWVGMKRERGFGFMWDNRQIVTTDEALLNITGAAPDKHFEVCYAVTKDDKLRPIKWCDSTNNFVCQIPNTTGPPIEVSTPLRTQQPSTAEDYTKYKPKTTRRPKTAVDHKVDKYVEKANKMKVEDKNSIDVMINMTSILITDLKDDDKTKGNVIKAVLMMEDFGMKYAKHHLKNANASRMMKRSKGFEMEMRRVVSQQRIVFPPNNEQNADQGSKTTIDLPDSLFNGQDTMLVNTIFTEITDYIPLKSEENDSMQQEIISAVISSSLDPKPVDILKDNVTIILEHYKKPSFEPSCVFWDINKQYSRNDLGGDWSNEGCTVVESNETSTVCSCSHLTSFALLMQVGEAPSATSDHQLVLSYITYIGCALSLIGEALTVLAYVVLMNMKQEQCQIRVNLAISLAVAQIFFLSGITATSNLGVCTFVAVMLHYFYLVAFGWMMLEGVYLYLMVVKVFNTIIKMKLYYIFAWGFPLVVVFISLIISLTLEDGIHSYTNQNFCWVSFSNGLIWAFVGPVLVILMINIFILTCAVREIVKLNRAKFDQAEPFRQGIKACVVLFPLLGLTWLFGLLSVTNAGLVFQYIFTILNSFQGILIFVLHCIRSGEIRSSFKHKIQRWEITRSTNFSSRSIADSSISSPAQKNLYQYSSTNNIKDNFTKHKRIEPSNGVGQDSKQTRECFTPTET